MKSVLEGVKWYRRFLADTTCYHVNLPAFKDHGDSYSQDKWRENRTVYHTLFSPKETCQKDAQDMHANSPNGSRRPHNTQAPQSTPTASPMFQSPRDQWHGHAYPVHTQPSDFRYDPTAAAGNSASRYVARAGRIGERRGTCRRVPAEAGRNVQDRADHAYLHKDR